MKIHSKSGGAQAEIFDKVGKNFDVEHYLTQAKGIGASDAVSHYISTGWKQNLDPNPWFSPSEPK